MYPYGGHKKRPKRLRRPRAARKSMIEDCIGIKEIIDHLKTGSDNCSLSLKVLSVEPSFPETAMLALCLCKNVDLVQSPL